MTPMGHFMTQDPVLSRALNGYKEKDKDTIIDFLVKYLELSCEETMLQIKNKDFVREMKAAYARPAAPVAAAVAAAVSVPVPAVPVSVPTPADAAPVAAAVAAAVSVPVPAVPVSVPAPAVIGSAKRTPSRVPATTPAGFRAPTHSSTARSSTPAFRRLTSLPTRSSAAPAGVRAPTHSSTACGSTPAVRRVISLPPRSSAAPAGFCPPTRSSAARSSTAPAQLVPPVRSSAAISRSPATAPSPASAAGAHGASRRAGSHALCVPVAAVRPDATRLKSAASGQAEDDKFGGNTGKVVKNVPIHFQGLCKTLSDYHIRSKAINKAIKKTIESFLLEHGKTLKVVLEDNPEPADAMKTVMAIDPESFEALFEDMALPHSETLPSSKQKRHFEDWYPAIKAKFGTMCRAQKKK